jgi:glucokinase
MLLCGDVGGTKTRLALYAPEDLLRPRRERMYSSREFEGLEPILADFLEHSGAVAPAGSITAACFGVAGPVTGNRARITNLPWRLDGAALATATSIPRFELVNDLVAMADGIPALRADELAVLQAGVEDPAGQRLLVAAGTGLGVAVLAHLGGRYEALPSEAAHADLAARDDFEALVLTHLRTLFGRASVERAVSGSGLRNLYDALRAEGVESEAPGTRAAIEAGDPSAAICEASRRGDPLARRAVDLFVSLYGSTAGNLALIAFATGGVYLGGGVTPKLLPEIQSGDFLRSFAAKDPFRPLLQSIPIRAILNDKTPLLGAARRAAGI